MLDIGNSFVKTCYRTHDGILRPGGRWPSAQPPDFASLLKDCSGDAVIASVIPGLSDAFRDVAAQRGVEVIEVTPASASCAGVEGIYPTMGADRVAGVIALATGYPAPAVGVDAGTAITFDVVGEGRRYRGGLIAPGPGLMVQALAEGTALLPPAMEIWDDFSLATDTNTAIAHGVSWGSIAMVEGILRLLDARVTKWRTLVLTGGLAPLISPHVPWDHVVDVDLVFKGLRVVWESTHACAHSR